MRGNSSKNSPVERDAPKDEVSNPMPNTKCAEGYSNTALSDTAGITAIEDTSGCGLPLNLALIYDERASAEDELALTLLLDWHFRALR